MIRKFGIAILGMVLTAGMVLAAEVDLETVTPPIGSNITVGPGGTGTPPDYTSLGIVDSGNNPLSITSATLSNGGVMIVGAHSNWSNRSANEVVATITTLRFGAGGGALGVANADLTITDKVIIASAPNHIAVREGTLNLTNGAEFNIANSLVVTGGGEVNNGKNTEIVLGARGALKLDTNGDTGGDFIFGDVVVDFDDSGSAVGYTGFGALSDALISFDSLDVRQGMIRIGYNGSEFQVQGKTVVGGYRENAASDYKSAAIRLDNLGTTYFGDDLAILGGGEIYGRASMIGDWKPATATMAANKNIIMNGYDNGDFYDRYWATIEGDPTGALRNTNGAPIQFLKETAASKSAVILNGTFNNIKGSVTFGDNPVGGNGWMDMHVDMKTTGWLQKEVDAQTLNTAENRARVRFSIPRSGTKYTSIAVIGNMAAGQNPWKTNVTVGNYTQDSGIVIGTSTSVIDTYIPGVDVGADPVANLIVHGKTKVTGGTYAVDSLIYDNMTFGNNSIEYVDRAILGAYDVNIVNQLAGTDFKILSLNINRNALIDVWDDLTLTDINTDVASDGDILFGGGQINVEADKASLINFRAPNSGSVKFSEGFMKGIVNSLIPVSPTDPYVLVQGEYVIDNGKTVPVARLNIPNISFSGLFGEFRTRHTKEDNTYELFKADTAGLSFDGSKEDFHKANDILNGMYGDRTSGGLNAMIYMSVSEGIDPTKVYDYERLYLVENPTAADINSFNMNFENLQHFAAGRHEALGALNLYNGNAMNGVNMVAQAVARSHIRTAMTRSDEIRETWNLVKNTVSGGDGLAASIMNSCANRIWVGGFGLWEDADERHDMAGYEYKSGGFVVGYDRIFGQNFIVGGSFAYNRGEYEDKAAVSHDSDIDNYSFNLYGTYTHRSGFFGTVFGGYTYSDNDINEGYLTDLNKYARSNHDNHTKTWVVGGKIGYDWKPTPCLYVTPSIGFTYINARTSGHTVRLGQNVLGHMSRLKDEAYYIPVEVNVGYDFLFANDSKMNVNLNFGYAYNFDEDGVSGSMALAGCANGFGYGVSSRDQGHHLFNIGAGGTYSRGRFDAGLKYDYYRQAKADTHRIMATFGVKF